MGTFTSLLPSGAFATPLPWQAEISFLFLAVLIIYSPRVIDSIRRWRESDAERHQEHDHGDDQDSVKEDRHDPD